MGLLFNKRASFVIKTHGPGGIKGAMSRNKNRGDVTPSRIPGGMVPAGLISGSIIGGPLGGAAGAAAGGLYDAKRANDANKANLLHHGARANVDTGGSYGDMYGGLIGAIGGGGIGYYAAHRLSKGKKGVGVLGGVAGWTGEKTTPFDGALFGAMLGSITGGVAGRFGGRKTDQNINRVLDQANSNMKKRAFIPALAAAPVLAVGAAGAAAGTAARGVVAYKGLKAGKSAIQGGLSSISSKMKPGGVPAPPAPLGKVAFIPALAAAPVLAVGAAGAAAGTVARGALAYKGLKAGKSAIQGGLSSISSKMKPGGVPAPPVGMGKVAAIPLAAAAVPLAVNVGRAALMHGGRMAGKSVIQGGARTAATRVASKEGLKAIGQQTAAGGRQAAIKEFKRPKNLLKARDVVNSVKEKTDDGVASVKAGLKQTPQEKLQSVKNVAAKGVAKVKGAVAGAPAPAPGVAPPPIQSSTGRTGGPSPLPAPAPQQPQTTPPVQPQPGRFTPRQ